MASLVIVVSAVWVLSCVQTDRQTHTDVDGRYTHATPVGVSNKLNFEVEIEAIEFANITDYDNGQTTGQRRLLPNPSLYSFHER